jgi:hypothetical protein
MRHQGITTSRARGVVQRAAPGRREAVAYFLAVRAISPGTIHMPASFPSIHGDTYWDGFESPFPQAASRRRAPKDKLKPRCLSAMLTPASMLLARVPRCRSRVPAIHQCPWNLNIERPIECPCDPLPDRQVQPRSVSEF